MLKWPLVSHSVNCLCVCARTRARVRQAVMVSGSQIREEIKGYMIDPLTWLNTDLGILIWHLSITVASSHCLHDKSCLSSLPLSWVLTFTSACLLVLHGGGTEALLGPVPTDAFEPPLGPGGSIDVDWLLFSPAHWTTSWLGVCPFSMFFTFPPMVLWSTLTPVRPSTRQLRASSFARSCRFSSCNLLTTPAKGLLESDSASIFWTICSLNALTSTWTSLMAPCRVFLNWTKESGSSTVLSMIHLSLQRNIRMFCSLLKRPDNRFYLICGTKRSSWNSPAQKRKDRLGHRYTWFPPPALIVPSHFFFFFSSREFSHAVKVKILIFQSWKTERHPGKKEQI